MWHVYPRGSRLTMILFMKYFICVIPAPSEIPHIRADKIDLLHCTVLLLPCTYYQEEKTCSWAF